MTDFFHGRLAAFGGIKLLCLNPSEGKDLSREKQSPKKKII